MRSRSDVRKKSKKKAVAKGSAAVVAKSPNDDGTIARLPRMRERFASIIKTTFSLEDPEETLEELLAALGSREQSLTPGVLRKQLADNSRLYRLAHQLYITARVDFENYEHDYEVIFSAMREEAVRQLNFEHKQKLRPKAPTLDDIKARMVDIYPDEMLAVKTQKTEAAKTIEHLNHLVDVFKARGFALKALVGGKEEL